MIEAAQRRPSGLARLKMHSVRMTNVGVTNDERDKACDRICSQFYLAETLTSSFGFRHSLDIRHSTFVICSPASPD